MINCLHLDFFCKILLILAHILTIVDISERSWFLKTFLDCLNGARLHWHQLFNLYFQADALDRLLYNLKRKESNLLVFGLHHWLRKLLDHIFVAYFVIIANNGWVHRVIDRLGQSIINLIYVRTQFLKLNSKCVRVVRYIQECTCRCIYEIVLLSYGKDIPLEAKVFEFVEGNASDIETFGVFGIPVELWVLVEEASNFLKL